VHGQVIERCLYLSCQVLVLSGSCLVRSSLVRSSFVWSSLVRSSLVRSSLVRSSLVRSCLVRSCRLVAASASWSLPICAQLHVQPATFFARVVGAWPSYQKVFGPVWTKHPPSMVAL